MREYIVKRQNEHYGNVTDDKLFALSCATLERLITNDGFGLAGENSRESWKSMKCVASYSPDLAKDLESIPGLDLDNELIIVICQEICLELNQEGIKNLVSIRFVRQEILDDEGNKSTRIGVRIRCC